MKIILNISIATKLRLNFPPKHFLFQTFKNNKKKYPSLPNTPNGFTNYFVMISSRGKCSEFFVFGIKG